MDKVNPFNHVINKCKALRLYRLRSRAAVQFLLRHLQSPLDFTQLVLKGSDVFNRHLYRTGFAVALLSGGAVHQVFEDRVVFVRADAASAGHLRSVRWEKKGDFLQGIVDPVATTLLSDFMGGALRGEIGGKSFGVGNAGEVRALKNVLIIGLTS